MRGLGAEQPPVNRDEGIDGQAGSPSILDLMPLPSCKVVVTNVPQGQQP